MQIISKRQLKELIENKLDYILIDVREKEELQYGMIPTAKNIPLPELEQALQLSEEEFQQKYQFNKPNKNQQLIFNCRTGGRSTIATQIAESLGYQAKNYKGSIWEWSEDDPDVKRYGPEP